MGTGELRSTLDGRWAHGCPLHVHLDQQRCLLDGQASQGGHLPKSTEGTLRPWGRFSGAGQGARGGREHHLGS